VTTDGRATVRTTAVATGTRAHLEWFTRAFLRYGNRLTAHQLDPDGGQASSLVIQAARLI
jgi:hypothetical protein